MQRLRGSDAFAIYTETANSPFVTLKVAIYRPTRSKDRPDNREIRDFIKRSISVAGARRAGLRILRVPLDLHHPVWVSDPDYSPDNHIFEVELPAPGAREQLCEFLSDLMGKPLDRHRPLWQVWIINGLEDGKVAIAFKVHHALADGKTIARLIERGHTATPSEGESDGEEIAQEPIPATPRLIGGALIDLARSYTVELPNFYRHLKAARRRGAEISDAVDRLVPPFSAPFTILNTVDVGGPGRIYRYETFSLADFKALSKTFDCTINTLVMGVCSEALKRYLEERDALPSESLIAAMPIGDQGGSSLERLLNSDIHNNNLAVAVLPLYQQIEDFGQRLREIKEAALAAINHVRHDEGRRFDNYLDFLPGTAIRLANSALTRRQRKRKNPHGNVVISNVPGPRETLYALDDRLEMDELLSVGNIAEQGHLNITVWSYVDNIAFSFFIRKDALPEPERMVEHLSDVVSELRDRYLAVPGKERTKRAAARR
jgi:WS/DGAT/MGAT family acyltransferase